MSAITDIRRPRFARAYIRAAQTAEQRGATEHRRRLLQGLHGPVFELGAGHGLNFPHYPPEVTEVIAIEPEPTLRACATEMATNSPVPVRVLPGNADAVPLAEESVDAVVASLVLCSVPNQDRARRTAPCAATPAASFASTRMSSPAANPNVYYCNSQTTAAYGPGSPAAATPPATPAPRSSTPASRSKRATGSCSPRLT